MLKSEKTVSKTIFWKDSANGARGIRARAYVGDDAHEADAARGRRRDPPEIGWDALRQPVTPHRCVSRREDVSRPNERRCTFSRRSVEKRRASRRRSGEADALARLGRDPRARRRELGDRERPRAR
jgi:hypothetical protein